MKGRNRLLVFRKRVGGLDAGKKGRYYFERNNLQRKGKEFFFRHAQTNDSMELNSTSGRQEKEGLGVYNWNIMGKRKEWKMEKEVLVPG